MSSHKGGGSETPKKVFADIRLLNSYLFIIISGWSAGRQKCCGHCDLRLGNQSRKNVLADIFIKHVKKVLFFKKHICLL